MQPFSENKSKGAYALFFFVADKKFLRENRRKNEKNKDITRFSNNSLKLGSVFAENSEKNVDICVKMFYIVSYTEYIFILG